MCLFFLKLLDTCIRPTSLSDILTPCSSLLSRALCLAMDALRLQPWPTNTVFTSCRNSSTRKCRITLSCTRCGAHRPCSGTHSLKKVSSMKALSSVGTLGLTRFSRRCCRWQRNWAVTSHDRSRRSSTLRDGALYIAALQQVLFNTAVPFSRQRCVVRIFLRLLCTWVSSVLLVQLDLLRHWNESTDCKDVSTSIRRSSMRILRDGEMDCAGCPQCGVHLAQKSELRVHQISHEPQLRTKIRAELTSNLSSTSASDKNPS